MLAIVDPTVTAFAALRLGRSDDSPFIIEEFICLEEHREPRWCSWTDLRQRLRREPGSRGTKFADLALTPCEIQIDLTEDNSPTVYVGCGRYALLIRDQTALTIPNDRRRRAGGVGYAFMTTIGPLLMSYLSRGPTPEPEPTPRIADCSSCDQYVALPPRPPGSCPVPANCQWV